MASLSENVSLTTQDYNYFIPFCREPWNKGEIPKFQMVKDIPLEPKKLIYSKGYVFLAEEPYRAFKQMPKAAPKNKTELDAIVQKISKLKHFIPWDYKEGCEQKARVTMDVLKLSGIPKENLKKQYCILPEYFDGKNWLFHVGVLVTLDDKNKTSWIVDPSLDPTQALSLEAWIGLQTKKLPKRETMIVSDRGHVRCISRKRPTYIDFKPEKALTFATEGTLLRVSTLKGVVKIGMPEVVIEDDLRDLAIFRGKV